MRPVMFTSSAFSGTSDHIMVERISPLLSYSLGLVSNQISDRNFMTKGGFFWTDYSTLDGPVYSPELLFLILIVRIPLRDIFYMTHP